MSANLSDYSDRGIILAIEDSVGPDGFAGITDIGDALGMRSIKGLGPRLAWMRKYGMVERHYDASPSRWKVSKKAGRAFDHANGAIDTIGRAKGVEFTVLRRTVEHYKRNGH